MLPYDHETCPCACARTASIVIDGGSVGHMCCGASDRNPEFAPSLPAVVGENTNTVVTVNIAQPATVVSGTDYFYLGYDNNGTASVYPYFYFDFQVRDGAPGCSCGCAALGSRAAVTVRGAAAACTAVRDQKSSTMCIQELSLWISDYTSTTTCKGTLVHSLALVAPSSWYGARDDLDVHRRAGGWTGRE